MARAGRKRKPGQRTKSGRLSRAGLAPYDHGTERAQAMKALYGDNWADAIECPYCGMHMSRQDALTHGTQTCAAFRNPGFLPNPAPPHTGS